jgi:hypothetical protein
MSFLLDPPLLVAAGATIEASGLPKPAKRALKGATLATFVGVSCALYLEKPWVRWFWRALGARSGRDWMLNSGVFSFRYQDNGWPTHVLAVLMFASYPVYLLLGSRLGARLRERRTS